MVTIGALWETYKTFAYPDGMAGEQEFQVKCAFYAGAATVFEEFFAAADAGSKAEADRIFDRFIRDIKEHQISLLRLKQN